MQGVIVSVAIRYSNRTNGRGGVRMLWMEEPPLRVGLTVVDGPRTRRQRPIR
jgi:hypothetical protein